MRESSIRDLIEHRKKLRKNATAAEVILWQALKSKKLATRKFRRQHSIGYFILDFYCPSEKLGIELDGKPHYTQNGKFRDKEKTGYLNSCGIRVIRFENQLIHDDLNFVLNTIQNNFSK
jgi:very-short-patch-repair endonuclease